MLSIASFGTHGVEVFASVAAHWERLVLIWAVSRHWVAVLALPAVMPFIPLLFHRRCGTSRSSRRTNCGISYGWCNNQSSGRTTRSPCMSCRLSFLCSRGNLLEYGAIILEAYPFHLAFRAYGLLMMANLAFGCANGL